MAATGCRQGCQEAFKASNFTLDHDNPELFITSQWLAKSWASRVIYVIYRCVVAVFWLIILVLSGVTDLGWYNPSVDGWMWFIYLTNWGLLILTLDVIFQAITSMYALVKGNQWHRLNSHLHMIFYLKIQWVIANIALCTGFFITIASGILFYSAGITLHYIDVASHLVNSIYLFFNLFISAMPFRVYHAFHTIAFCLAYLLFSVILQYTDNIVAYPGIYMTDPQILVMSIFLGAILAVTVLWLFIYGLYRVRLAIAGSTTSRHTIAPREEYTLKPYSVFIQYRY